MRKVAMHARRSSFEAGSGRQATSHLTKAQGNLEVDSKATLHQDCMRQVATRARRSSLAEAATRTRSSSRFVAFQGGDMELEPEETDFGINGMRGHASSESPEPLPQEPPSEFSLVRIEVERVRISACRGSDQWEVPGGSRGYPRALAI